MNILLQKKKAKSSQLKISCNLLIITCIKELLEGNTLMQNMRIGYFLNSGSLRYLKLCFFFLIVMFYQFVLVLICTFRVKRAFASMFGVEY